MTIVDFSSNTTTKTEAKFDIKMNADDIPLHIWLKQRVRVCNKFKSLACRRCYVKFKKNKAI